MRLKWAKEIDNAPNAYRTKYYPTRKALAVSGFQPGLPPTPIWLVTISLPSFRDGIKCPYCSGKADINDTDYTVKSESYDPYYALLEDPYIEASCTCEFCRQSWIVRSKGDEVCLDYTPKRDDVPFELSKLAYVRTVKTK